jgi:oxygen-independent coproporphyrinogen-3 oxidase
MSPGLYVHVPFCARACPYCDFDFEVGRAPRTEAFIRGLGEEWEARRGAWAQDRFGTVYLGGGTPSLLGVEGLRRLLDWLRAEIPLGDLEELTVEANPEHCDAETIAALPTLGVTRISLGVQSFDQAGLRTLGRVHDEGRAREATRLSLLAGLETSVDLIVGWPGQDTQSLERDVAAIDSLGVHHVSVYALTVEPGTPWETLVRRGRRQEPDGDRQADLLERARERLSNSGFEHYEVSNYCRAGLRSRHNTRYWRWSDYLGLGPSAHSARFGEAGGVHRRGNRRGLAGWLANPGEAQEEERLSGHGAAREGLWTGLRMFEGVTIRRFLERFDVKESWLRRVTARQRELGNLELAEGRLRIARDRWLWHDGIAADLLAGEDRSFEE